MSTAALNLAINNSSLNEPVPIAVARDPTVDAFLAEVKVAIVTYRAVEMGIRNSSITAVATNSEWPPHAFLLENGFGRLGFFLLFHDWKD
jgi:hypothetical protein